jgi:hypothetical protein
MTISRSFLVANIGAALTLAASACGDRAGPPAPAQVRATSGADQTATVRTPLRDPIVVTVVDGAGSPLPGVRVQWSAEADGRIVPAASTTDAEGRAAGHWVLGSTAGISHASAVVPDLEPAVFTATAEPVEVLPFDDLRILRIPTYDGSGQVVHPDYLATPADLFASASHLAITPYPGGDPAYENPSLFIATRPDEWSLQGGAPNPVVQTTAGYLSDPDIVFHPESGELWLYYRQVTRDNLIFLIRSSDGVHWSTPLEVVRRPRHEVVSPSVVRRGPGDWYMWAVNAGPEGCDALTTTVDVRRSMDGERWSDPVPVAMKNPGLWPWHLEVQWIPARNEFWALYNAKTAVGCTSPVLLLSTSPDGFTWSRGIPVLEKGRVPQFADVVYRSTLDYDPVKDAITFWYSGARYDANARDYVWSAAVERRRWADIFDGSAALVGESVYSPPPAPLERWP